MPGLLARFWAKVIPHAGFLVPSPTNTLLATGGPIASNVSASEVTVTYHASQVTIEYFLPHDRLAVQTNGLTSPAETVPRSNPKTGQTRSCSADDSRYVMKLSLQESVHFGVLLSRNFAAGWLPASVGSYQTPQLA
jgi:hypothetical protein